MTAPRRSLSGKRIMITGGAGLIGSHLADQLAGRGVAEVLVYDDLSRGRASNLEVARSAGVVTLVEADIRDRAALGRAMAGIDVLFHLAAIRLTQCAEFPRLALDVMVEGTFNVVERAVDAGVARTVFASSASIYGMAERFPTDESHHPYDNNTLYGAAKLFGEGLLRSTRERSGLDYVALRPFNVYGPRMDTEGAYTEVLIRWMERIARGQAPIIFGDGSQSMDFVYVDDVARAFVLAAEANAAGEVFNIASGVETSLAALARALIAAMGANVGVEHGPERKFTAVPRRWADTRKAHERLGFEAAVGLDEGLARLVAWWRARADAPRAGTAPAGSR